MYYTKLTSRLTGKTLFPKPNIHCKISKKNELIFSKYHFFSVGISYTDYLNVNFEREMIYSQNLTANIPIVSSFPIILPLSGFLKLIFTVEYGRIQTLLRESVKFLTFGKILWSCDSPLKVGLC